MNELNKRGYEGVESAIKDTYSCIEDGSLVTCMLYVQLDITNKETLGKVIN